MEELLNKREYNILKNSGITRTSTTLNRNDKTAFLISTFKICFAARSRQKACAPLFNIVCIKDHLYILFYKAYIVVSKVINS